MPNSDRFIGEIEPSPIDNRWHWPFATMQPGDWFLVRKSLRDPEKLRRQVSVRQAQLGKFFSFEKHPPEHPGCMKVRCRSGYIEPRVRCEFDYDGLRHLLREQYGVDADALPWSRPTNVGDSEIWGGVKRKVKDSRYAVFVRVAGKPFIVQLWDNLVSFTRVEEGETIESWKRKQLAAMLE